jgi:hypothetical protein
VGSNIGSRLGRNVVPNVVARTHLRCTAGLASPHRRAKQKASCSVRSGTATCQSPPCRGPLGYWYGSRSAPAGQRPSANSLLRPDLTGFATLRAFHAR